MQPIPFIPENAPFTPEQRSWLNGYLAGIFSAAPATAVAPAATSLKIAVLHASQSGTSEGLARKVAKELKAKGHTTSIASLESYTPQELAAEQHAVLIASTYGEGDPPDAAKPFFQQLCLADAPRLDHLSYTVLALGDKNYEHFCKFGCDLDERLVSLGAQRIAPRVECDVDVDEPFGHWKTDLMKRLEAIGGGESSPPAVSAVSATVPTVPTDVVVPKYNREHPFKAEMLDRRALTSDISSKLTVHLAFSLPNEELVYEAGDALGVIPQNDPLLIANVLEAAQLTGGELVQLPKLGEMRIDQALSIYSQMNHLNRKMVDTFAELTQSHRLQALLAPEQQSHLEDYCYGRGILDLLIEYPGAIATADDLVTLLPRLAPRLYSISSSPVAHRDQVHTTVAVVRYRSYNRERGGVCSTMLAERTTCGDAVPVYIQPNKRFRLPVQGDAPIIMIGPGTGIAPFRAFLHERRALGSSGCNWLFFGERSAATDFLYQEELLSMQADSHLTRLDLAFSRDQEKKIYVQDRMLEQAAEFWRWLQDGASIYVCGDASRMAKDVDATLHKIVEQQSGLDREAVSEYVQQLKDEHRYHRDVY